jgi:hypothetical protein
MALSVRCLCISSLVLVLAPAVHAGCVADLRPTEQRVLGGHALVACNTRFRHICHRWCTRTRVASDLCRACASPYGPCALTCPDGSQARPGPEEP